jgi:hypothetical protein
VRMRCFRAGISVRANALKSALNLKCVRKPSNLTYGGAQAADMREGVYTCVRVSGTWRACLP